jgi:BON domain
MAKKRNRRERRERRAPRQPISAPIMAESQLAELEGRRDTNFGEAAFPADRVEELDESSLSPIYDGDREPGSNGALVNEPESLELLMEHELRSDETDDAEVAAQEGLPYVPPFDEPNTLDSQEGSELDNSFAGSAVDDLYATSGAPAPESDIALRVREALRADSTTSAYADQVQISERGGRVVLRGTVDDLLDADNLVAVASYATGVAEVVDELVIRALERS